LVEVLVVATSVDENFSVSVETSKFCDLSFVVVEENVEVDETADSVN